MSAATATATTEVSTATSVTAAEVGTATSATTAKVGTAASSAMCRELWTTGVVPPAHGASSALRVEVGSASRTNLTKPGRTLGTRIPLARHCVLSDVPISALPIAPLATAVAK